MKIATFSVVYSRGDMYVGRCFEMELDDYPKKREFDFSDLVHGLALSPGSAWDEETEQPTPKAVKTVLTKIRTRLTKKGFCVLATEECTHVFVALGQPCAKVVLAALRSTYQ